MLINGICVTNAVRSLHKEAAFGHPFLFSARVGLAKIWHTEQMPTSSAKPKLVPCHFTVEDLQLIEWSCREKAQRARSDAKRDTTPSSIETFTSTATKYEALASRISA